MACLWCHRETLPVLLQGGANLNDTDATVIHCRLASPASPAGSAFRGPGKGARGSPWPPP
jgi:hypothetical protein